jgi:adenylylsulfate kinase-like enzyme
VSDRSDARAVLITGTFGTGKTSLIEELAEVLEDRGIRYAAIDLDWLAWFDPGGGDHEAATPVMLRNVDDVVANYYATGIRTYALARTMETKEQIRDLQTALGMPLTTVELTAPLQEIERRLRGAITSGRATDLAGARAWMADARTSACDITISNDRPIREVAIELFTALDW